MFRARREKLATCLPEIIPLLETHWAELAHHKDSIPLNPNFDSYIKLEDAGNFRAYTVRDSEHNLAGYAGYFLHQHMHYMPTLWAVSDLVYVHPDYRSSRKILDRLGKFIAPPVPAEKGAGTVLMEAVEDDLKGAGVAVMHTHAKLEHPGLFILLRKLGHKATEIGISKKL